jgi:hypothetical protein
MNKMHLFHVISFMDEVCEVGWESDASLSVEFLRRVEQHFLKRFFYLCTFVSSVSPVNLR